MSSRTVLILTLNKRMYHRRTSGAKTFGFSIAQIVHNSGTLVNVISSNIIALSTSVVLSSLHCCHCQLQICFYQLLHHYCCCQLCQFCLVFRLEFVLVAHLFVFPLPCFSWLSPFLAHFNITTHQVKMGKTFWKCSIDL